MTGPDWRPTADRATLGARADLLADIRAFMHVRDVLEVDTGVLARAAPSERGLDSFAVPGAGYLVPSPEHTMKRLLAAGSGPIYQLGHVFRAGEAGRWHNPEFCMLEWYRPSASIADLIAETRTLIETLTGMRCAPPLRYRDVFLAHAGIDPLDSSTPELAATARRRGIAPAGAAGDDRAFWLDLVMSLVVQPQLGGDRPVCVTDFPAVDAVLVELDPADNRIARRFECYWRGVELANGAQELTDAGAARKCMQREIDARAEAKATARVADEKLLAAMAAGLPPCAGVALGVDRLLALMLDRDALAGVLPFDWARR